MSNRSGLCSPGKRFTIRSAQNIRTREDAMGFSVHWLVGAAIAVGFAVAGSAARADAVQDLAAIAAKKGPVIWYESSPPEAVLKIAAAFNKKYPDIKIQFVRLTGGGG